MTYYNPELLPKIRSDALRQACSDYPCTLRISSFIPGFRCSSQDTVVGAHLPIWGKGTATKVTDLAIAAACLHCHDLIDRRDSRIDWIEQKFPAALVDRYLRGLCETQALWVRDGLIWGDKWEMVL